MRTRAMALLSDATLIVEAGETSGTLHQGWEALRLGRPLCIDDALLHDPSLSWPHEMVRYGAQPLRSPDDVEWMLELLPEGARGEAAELAF